jgi:DNA-binding HxlR family transcriptional regulator
MRRSPQESQVCSIARALGELGERWTLLILREAYFGTRQFTEFHRRLGVARNILTARLNGLVKAGILTRAVAPGRGGPRVYRLTDKGRDALPAFVALMQWGDRWLDEGREAPVIIVEAATGRPIEAVCVRAGDGRPLAPRELRVIAGPGASAEIRQRFGAADAAPSAKASPPRG